MYKINQIKTDGQTYPWVLRATLMFKGPLLTAAANQRQYFSTTFKDETGTIRAVAFDNFGDVVQAHAFLEMGSVYNIRDATVKTANKKYGSTGIDYELVLPMLTNLEKVEDHSLPKKARKNGDEADIPQPSTSTKDKHETPGNFENKFEQKLVTFVGKETDRDQMEPVFISEVDEKVWGYPVCIDCTQKLTKWKGSQWKCNQCDEATEQFNWNLSINVRAFDGKSLYYIACNGKIAEVILDEQAAKIGAMCMAKDSVEQQTKKAIHAAGNVFLAKIVENLKPTGKTSAKITAISNEISKQQIISLLEAAIKVNDDQRLQLNQAGDEQNRLHEQFHRRSTTTYQKEAKEDLATDHSPKENEKNEDIHENVPRSG